MKAVHPRASDEPIRIGAKLRASRLAHGMTLERLAAATTLSPGFLSRVERDETSPSVATLVTLCQILSLPVGSLFDEPETAVIDLDDAPLMNLAGTGATDWLLTPRGQSMVQVLRSVLEPGANGGDELYTINCEIAVAHVLRGEVTITVGGRDVVMPPGTTLTFRGREPHTWRNSGSEPAELIWIIAPAAWSGTS